MSAATAPPTGLSEPEFTLSPADFERIRQLIYQRAGISLHAEKQAMVYSRLSRRLRETGYSSFAEWWLIHPASFNKSITIFTPLATLAGRCAAYRVRSAMAFVRTGSRRIDAPRPCTKSVAQRLPSSSMTRLIGPVMTSSGNGSLARTGGRSLEARAGAWRARSSACWSIPWVG